MDEAESKRHLEEMSKIIKERDEAERGRNLYRSFLYKDEVLGVLGLFTRIPIPEQGPAWLRIFADDIAVAFVNARAFEENDRLRARLELETAYLPEEVREAKSLGDIIGQSASLTDLQRQMDMVAPTDAHRADPGRTGTGKELVAREIHQRSRRSQTCGCAGLTQDRTRFRVIHTRVRSQHRACIERS